VPKIALAQINTTIGDFDGTVRKVVDHIQRAKSVQADLIVFPEMTLTGYPPRDLLEEPHFITKNLQALEEVARAAEDIDVVIGYVDRRSGDVGKPLSNAAALCRSGKVVATYSKNLLPTYDVFDEGRYFEPGNEVAVWKIQSSKMGFSICEDIWNDKSSGQNQLYAADPIPEQVNQGADFLLNISASPFTCDKPQRRRSLLSALAKRHGVPLVYVNLVGANDELVFDGRSMVMDSQGRIAAEAKAYEEDFLVVDTDHLQPISFQEFDDVECIFEALVLGVRDYARKCGFQKAVLGLSGGIDSTLTAVIAAEALGAENVLGVAMPSPYSSEGSVKDAQALAQNLKIQFEKYSIGTVYGAYRDLFGRQGAPDLADENVQARIRGNILMSLSNRRSLLVLTTGNKSELAVGYCTLYGDMSGGLAVISDVPKTLVYELCRWIQKKKPVIPESVFTKPPSAELRPDQKDVDSLPPYDILDPILKAVIEDKKSEKEIVAMGFKAEIVADVLKRIYANEYKRRQAAPGIKITSRAFGIGWRYPIAKKV
jgi:NAD+ synthase (glutamine-hydrolysing)